MTVDPKVSLLQKIAAAGAEMDNPKKRASNPHFKSKFANLADTMDVIEPVLEKHGLSHTFYFDGTVLVYMVFDPKTSAVLESKLDIGTLMEGLEGNVWQQMGQSFTYLRRYLSQALWGLVPEDDDGNGAPQRSKPAAARRSASGKLPRPAKLAGKFDDDGSTAAGEDEEL